mmetsp:Transcript_52268/g.166446  ORF Transcript_52268/g.166446 Transcript_52268/m.166446 type:complete len:549 (+) Transcript_52268:62-1708(+)
MASSTSAKSPPGTSSARKVENTSRKDGAAPALSTRTPIFRKISSAGASCGPATPMSRAIQNMAWMSSERSPAPAMECSARLTPAAQSSWPCTLTLCRRLSTRATWRPRAPLSTMSWSTSGKSTSPTALSPLGRSTASRAAASTCALARAHPMCCRLERLATVMSPDGDSATTSVLRVASTSSPRTPPSSIVLSATETEVSGAAPAEGSSNPWNLAAAAAEVADLMTAVPGTPEGASLAGVAGAPAGAACGQSPDAATPVCTLRGPTSRRMASAIWSPGSHIMCPHSTACSSASPRSPPRAASCSSSGGSASPHVSRCQRHEALTSSAATAESARTRPSPSSFSAGSCSTGMPVAATSGSAAAACSAVSPCTSLRSDRTSSGGVGSRRGGSVAGEMKPCASAAPRPPSLIAATAATSSEPLMPVATSAARALAGCATRCSRRAAMAESMLLLAMPSPRRSSPICEVIGSTSRPMGLLEDRPGVPCGRFSKDELLRPMPRALVPDARRVLLDSFLGLETSSRGASSPPRSPEGPGRKTGSSRRWAREPSD